MTATLVQRTQGRTLPQALRRSRHGLAAAGVVLAAWWGVVLAGYAVDVALLARAGVRQARARGARTEPPPVPLPDPRNVVPTVVPGSMS